MKTRRSFLSVLSAVPLLGLGLGTSGCSASAAVVLTTVEAGISDAQIAITTIMTGVDAYFDTHSNPALKAQIDGAVSDVTTALRAVNSALAGATSIADGNVQTALAAFASAWATVMTLVAQIGIQVAPAGVTAVAKVNGITYVPPPRLLSLVKAAPAPVAPADKLVPAPPIK
jgi:hypothetical protein